jgi:5'-3' exoribonuclease 2
VPLSQVPRSRVPNLFFDPLLTPRLCRQVVDGKMMPLDTSQASPNARFDNLYLDMNGIIHPCVHPEGRDAPATQELMLEAIFDYIDFIFSIVRPRRLLFMAVDGVAPRAKMNQQRSRRFKSIEEAAHNARVEADIRRHLEEELARRGVPIPPKLQKERFDYNCKCLFVVAV